MESVRFGHRQQERQQQQQQPQQSAFYPVQADSDKQGAPEYPRKTWQQLAMAQARQQSGGEL